MLADGVKLIVNYMAFILNFTEVVFWQIISAMLLEREDIFTPMGLLIGAIADIIVTSLFGVVFIYFIYFVGKDYLWIKGIGYGMVIWVSVFGIVLAQLVNDKIPSDPSGILVTVVAHFFFGAALALFTKLFIDNMTFFSEDLQKVVTGRTRYKLIIPDSVKKLARKKPIKEYKKPQKI